jgi:hypothetical protein
MFAAMMNDIRSRLIPAWLATAAIDGAFASALTVFGYHSTVGRLWRGVASTLFGPAAMQGGPRLAYIGFVMHIGVALLWTSVFFALYSVWPRLREIVSTPRGTIAVAAIYGPLIWVVMSLVVIPLVTGRPPNVQPRWFIQLAGHFPFVALPIVAIIGRGFSATTRRANVRVARRTA